MKTLAELIAELQKIPNPEKVGVAVHEGDGCYDLVEKDLICPRFREFHVLSDNDAKKARDQELTSLLTF